MKAGDEVLMTDQEHPGGEHPWDLRAKRYGVVVKKIILPKPVMNPTQVVKPVPAGDHAAHPRHLLQPHHHLLGRSACQQKRFARSHAVRESSPQSTARTFRE